LAFQKALFLNPPCLKQGCQIYYFLVAKKAFYLSFRISNFNFLTYSLKTLLKWGPGSSEGSIFALGWPKKALEQFIHGTATFFPKIDLATLV
jgi:hypothetical protein